MPCTLRGLLDVLSKEWEIELPKELDTLEIGHVVTDSRDVSSGDVFVALAGSETDGQQFIPMAVSAGASAIFQIAEVASITTVDGCWYVKIPCLPQHLLSLLQYRYPDASNLSLLGVTGTNGKSSITQYVAQLATALGYPCGVVGTVGNGIWPNLVPTRNTTPGLAVMYRVLDEFAREGARFAAVEVSSHGLDQGRVNGLRVSSAALTNLTQDHLDYHGDMESYYQAKRRLFTDFGISNALINTGSEYGQRLLVELDSSIRVISVDSVGAQLNPDIDTGSSVRWSLLDFSDQGMQVHLSTPWGDEEFQLPLIGDFNLANTAQAIAMLACEGLNFGQLVEAASTLRPVAGRMELFSRKDSPGVVLDFAHTPDALDNVLRSLSLWNKPIFVVFGCGGDRDREKRPLMTAAALRYGATVILTDDNPRFEDPDQIWADALQIEGAERVKCEHDRRLAIEGAITQAPSEGLVLIAGKGHEDYQDIQGRKRPFSDLAVLENLGYQRVGEKCVS